MAYFLKAVEEKKYKLYITDALKSYLHLNISYREIIDTTPPDNRTEEDIISGLKEKMRRL